MTERISFETTANWRDIRLPPIPDQWRYRAWITTDDSVSLHMHNYNFRAELEHWYAYAHGRETLLCRSSSPPMQQMTPVEIPTRFTFGMTRSFNLGFGPVSAQQYSTVDFRREFIRRCVIAFCDSIHERIEQGLAEHHSQHIHPAFDPFVEAVARDIEAIFEAIFERDRRCEWQHMPDFVDHHAWRNRYLNQRIFPEIDAIRTAMAGYTVHYRVNNPEEEVNALALLKSTLGDAAYQQYQERKCIEVISACGNKYILRCGSMTEDVKRGHMLCYQIPYDYHPIDKMIAEALAIQTDEKRYLKTANKW